MARGVAQTSLTANANHPGGQPLKAKVTEEGADGPWGPEAEAAIERLATAPADECLVMRDIWLLRLRARLAQAHGDDARYREQRDRYRDMARTIGFEGHIAWAEAMP